MKGHRDHKGLNFFNFKNSVSELKLNRSTLLYEN